MLAVALSAALFAGGAARADTPVSGSGADAYRFMSDYAALGLHRTGTSGNTTAAGWLAERFTAFGLDTTVETFEFPQFLPSTVSLKVGSFSPQAFPLYYYGRTGPDGVTAPLVDAGLGTPVDTLLHPVAGKIAIVEVPMPLPGAALTLGRALTEVANAGAVALIAVTDAPLNTISVPDVDARGGFCNLPTLLVGKHDGDKLRSRAGQNATLVLDAEQRIGAAENVLGILPGASDDVLVIGTPITGWFTAAVERGAGIGALVTLARYFAEKYADTPPPQTILFVGTSGHEVGFLGLEKLLEAHPDLASRVSTYLHLGAGVSAKGYVALGDLILETGLPEPLRLLTVSENPILDSLALSAALKNAVVPVLPVPEGAGASGEEAFLYAAGVPVVALKSIHLWIHTPRDRPSGTSAALLDPVVHMYRDLAAKLLAQDPAALRAANAVAAAIAPLTADVLKGVGVVRCTP